MSLVSPELAGGFFITSHTWKAPVHGRVKLQSCCRYPCLDIQGICLCCSQFKHNPRDFRQNVSKAKISPSLSERRGLNSPSSRSLSDAGVAQPGHLEKSSWMLTMPGPVQQGSCKRNLSLSGTDAGHSQGHAAVCPLSFLGRPPRMIKTEDKYLVFRLWLLNILGF